MKEILSNKVQGVKRALRVIDAFTLGTFNPPSPYAMPYTAQMTRSLTSPKVF